MRPRMYVVTLAFFAVAHFPAGTASAQTFSGRIGAAGSSVPSTTATTGATQNPRIGVSLPPVNSDTVRKRLIIGNTIGHTIGR